MNYTYIFIMILILVMIYGLLFRLKNKKIISTINNIESFENTSTLQNVTTLYESAIPEFAQGKWTSNTSDVISDQVTNTLSFIIGENSKGNMNYNGKKFDVKINSNSTITTNEVDGEKYLFNPNPDYNSYRLPFDVNNIFKNVPIFEMIDQGEDSNNKRSLIFKFNKGKLDPSALTLLSNKTNNYNPTQPNISGVFFSPSSVESIKSYKYKPDALIANYISKEEYAQKNNLTPGQANKKIDYIKKIYNNNIPFQIKRRFTYSNNQNLDSKFSPLYNFEFEKNDQILDSLTHKSLTSELSENKLNTKFYDISSYIYLHKVNESKDVYNFSKPNMLFNKDSLKLKNNASSYVENNLFGVRLNSAQKIVDSKFQPEMFSFINTYNSSNKTEGTNTASTINVSAQSLNIN